jgi:hypothetical protein
MRATTHREGFMNQKSDPAKQVLNTPSFQPASPENNFGECADDAALREAWKQFCRQLEAAGDRVFKKHNPPSPEHRVDGFRFLTQNLSQAFDLALETRDPKYPAIHAFCAPARKLGSDNADCIYLQAWIDGQSAYKISGKRGGARMWNIAVQGQRSATAYGFKTSVPLHDPFGDIPEANMFGHELETNWDGSFELYIGGERRSKNWLPTTSGTRKLFMRQYFDDWSEEPGQFSIERLGMNEPRPLTTVPQMIDAMNWAGQFCYDVADYWPDFMWIDNNPQLDASKPNAFGGEYLAKRRALSTTADAGESRRGRLVAQMRWDVAIDEALLLEFDNFDGFWMVTCEGVFCNSMDYLYRPVSYTPSRTAVDSDGKVRLVMTRDDPGFANWIDNQGYTRGVLSFRTVMTDHVPDLRTSVIKVKDLAAHMPKDAKRSNAEERASELHRRFNAIRRRYRI